MFDPATTANVDINSLVERSPPVGSPGNASTTSRTSNNSSRVREGTTGSARTSSITAASTPAPSTHTPVEASHLRQHQQQPYHQYPPSMQATHYPAPYPQPHPFAQYPPMSAYPTHQPTSIPDPRLPPPLSMTHAPGPSNKRLAPSQPHPAESPAKKKQSKWTADEDAAIIELRGNGMKWEDISKHLPGRSAISCRLRFQNYLERRSEWDEEKKNKLARLYERYEALSIIKLLSRTNSRTQIQEGHVGEDLERDATSMAGCRSDALADRRGRNGTTRQRTSLPSRRRSVVECDGATRTRQQYLAIVWNRSSVADVVRAHPPAQPPSNTSSAAAGDVSCSTTSAQQ